MPRGLWKEKMKQKKQIDISHTKEGIGQGQKSAEQVEGGERDGLVEGR
jgi:hypothetical protein